MEIEKLRRSSYLHGTLEATIFQANNSILPCNCMNLGSKAAYVQIKLGKIIVAETSYELNRVWNQSFRVQCAHPADNTTVEIILRTRSSILGKINVPAYALLNISDIESIDNSSFPLLSKNGKDHKNLKLLFSLKLIPASRCSKGFHDLNIRDATFPPRSNCSVVLYQDSHHACFFRPPLEVLGGEACKPRKLWEDVFMAIDGAKHLVYIAGWSLNPNIVLVRDPATEIQRARGVKLGELLKRKAEEGVAVRVMLWDDETSFHTIKNQGVMRTHDEDALAYFKHTRVVCRLTPRLNHHFPTVFAHHQKTITVDASTSLFSHVDDNPASCDAREIMSFIGGVDLCNGRYDTEEHSLFRTLDTEFQINDFYQINFTGAELQKGGPREPWHDAHACIKGKAALDVLANFEHRWAKQCDPSLLVSIDKIPDLVNQHRSNGKECWNVQVLRSIDKMSSNCLPEDCSVEHSIQNAYVEAIRRAEKFIYIENQYFIGGCQFWTKEKHSGCNNIIPVEVALKVAAKIRAKERFSAYIIIPMWPEGVPESELVQDILHWTRLTMEAMYKIVGIAIQETGVDAHPKDYLNFYCLANREEKRVGEFVPPHSPPQATNYWRAQQSRRFMIYVHSKLMIVDDKYLIVGSANVNQRSMDGGRDTEIAIGCYQPSYIGGESSRGDIHTYRMSLWYEHTLRIEDVFQLPESIDCVKRLCDIGEKAWNLYNCESVVDIGVHLVNYPINVLEDGTVVEFDNDYGIFPDTSAPIKGKRSKILPPICTT